MVDTLFIMGALAGLLQVLGYIVYISDGRIDPNPVTWFMFAYGTALLTVLEWDSDAFWPELFLPIVCSLLSMYVCYRCWKRARKLDATRWWPRDWWPEDRWEQSAFVSDIIISVLYVASWVVADIDILSEELRNSAVLAFLILANLSTIPAFYPLLKGVIKDNGKERMLPWAIWTVSYSLLAFVTYASHGTVMTVLLLYPLINVFLHGWVFLIARN
jgi:hypothetical protein